MAHRSASHAELERKVFDAFLAVHGSLRALVKDNIDQPDAEFPDITVKLSDGTLIDFELAEWLDGVQMAAAKRRDQLEKAILTAVSAGIENPSRHFLTVMLSPRDDAPVFGSREAEAFRASFFKLLSQVELRWPAERFWHSTQGYTCRDLTAHSPLDRYLVSIHFDPRVVGGVEQRWASGQPYIFFESAVGSYSPATALNALAGIVGEKLNKYAPFVRPTRLLIHYGQAFSHNTPYYGVDTRTFEAVAEHAAASLPTQTGFEKIYLFKAFSPGAEAFEVYPTCTRLE